MNKDLILKIVAEHKHELKEKFGVERIALFGSYARGEENPKSDIDFVIELSKPDLFKMVAVKNYLKTLLNSEIDLVRYRDRMNEFLKKRILSDAIYV
jgi:predicted nucleotidyltransferase